MSEYVKIKAGERVFGESTLLQAQLSLINTLKQYQEYQNNRKEELFLKIELKKELGEVSILLDGLNKILPESNFMEEEKEKEKMKREIAKKIERYVQKSKKNLERPWGEKGEEERKSFIEVVKESNKFEKKQTRKEEDYEVKSELDKELEEIRRKLERLQ